MPYLLLCVCREDKSMSIALHVADLIAKGYSARAISDQYAARIAYAISHVRRCSRERAGIALGFDGRYHFANDRRSKRVLALCRVNDCRLVFRRERIE